MSTLSKKKVNLFDALNFVFMVAVCAAIIYPLWFCFVFSLNDANDTAVNGLAYFWPRVITFDNYIMLKDSVIYTAFGISILRTLIGTSVHVFFTAMVAYAFSKKRLPGRKLYLSMGTISLFFSGGLIPYYLLIRSLGLIDNFLVYILPMAFNFFDALIFMGFFSTINDSIEESAKIDGANDFYIFIKLILPLSAPVVATITIFNGVSHWNDFFSGFIFINKKSYLIPIQTFLYQMVATTEAYSRIPQLTGFATRIKITPESVRVAVMIVATAPMIVVYPFLQKYFTKGIMLGSVKE